MSLQGMPRPLECLLQGLLEENHLSSWTSDWADGDVTLTIKFSPKGKTQNTDSTPRPMSGVVDSGTHQGAASGATSSYQQPLFSPEDEKEIFGVGLEKKKIQRAASEEGSADNPRKYHLLEMGSVSEFAQKMTFSPDPPTNMNMSNNTRCGTGGIMGVEDRGMGRRGITPSVSSSSEETGMELGGGKQKVRCYRTINIRDIGNTYSSSSAENSSPEGFDEVDNPLKTYNHNNASDAADNFDATRLVDIP